jgi:flavin-dependent dehydrogenase
VARIGMHKPGATLTWSPTASFSFRFARYRRFMVPYAYNVPRREFDAILLARAEAVGARRIPMRADLVRNAADACRELALAPAAHAETGWDTPPDLIVDATGRARRMARLLEIPATVGPRNDVAHFAHFTGYAWTAEPGQVLIDRIDGGWSWRIPLKDRLSVGVVVNRDAATRLGGDPETRLDAAIAATEVLRSTLQGATRVTAVATYSNYQLISARGCGLGWTAVGDAFGFVDPMLSPGVMVSLRSAEMLRERLVPWRARPPAVDARALAAAIQPYVDEYRALLESWMVPIEHLYNGRMMALFQAGQEMMTARGGRFLTGTLQGHIEQNIAGLASGTWITSRYSLGLLRFLGRRGLRGVMPEPLAIP